MVLYDYGVDLDSRFTFKDGDINIISYNENIKQAISNRLNTDLNEMDLFYEDYGSVITGFLGWKRIPTTLSFIKLEVENCLKKDSRIQAFETEVYFQDDGSVGINLVLYPMVLTVNLVLNNNGVELKEE